MINHNLISNDLLQELEKIKKYNPGLNLLDYAKNDEGIIANKKVYYEYGNILGVLNKSVYSESYSVINKNEITAGDLEVLVKNSKWFKKGV